MSDVTRHTDTSSFVTVREGMRGWFAVQMWWNPEMGGFWEPWQTSPASFSTPEEAEQDAKGWAEAEEIRFVPHTGRMRSRAVAKRLDDLHIHTWHNSFEWCACLGEYDLGTKVFTGRWQREAIDDLLDYYENEAGEIHA